MNQITLTGTVATEPACRPGLAQPAVAFRLEVPRPDPGAESLYVDIVCLSRLTCLVVEVGVGTHPQGILFA